jgi:hypothetical protein
VNFWIEAMDSELVEDVLVEDGNGAGTEFS